MNRALHQFSLHEAAHAVAAIVCGRVVTDVYASEIGGQCAHSAAFNGTPAEQLMSEMTILAAGPIAKSMPWQLPERRRRLQFPTRNVLIF